MNKNTCPFCDSEQKYRYITEGSLVKLIYPLAPACKYHVLIVPKRHAERLDQLNADEIAETHALLQRLVSLAQQNFADFEGYNILSNNGGVAVRQVVGHCHVHVFLRMASEKLDPFKAAHSVMPDNLTAAQLQNLKVLQVMFSK